MLLHRIQERGRAPGENFVKPVDFAYKKARSIDHALRLLKENVDDAALLSGGQSLLPILNMRLATPALLIDISHLEVLRGIERQGKFIRIGGATRHVALQRSPGRSTRILYRCVRDSDESG